MKARVCLLAATLLFAWVLEAQACGIFCWRCRHHGRYASGESYVGTRPPRPSGGGGGGHDSVSPEAMEAENEALLDELIVKYGFRAIDGVFQRFEDRRAAKVGSKPAAPTGNVDPLFGSRPDDGGTPAVQDTQWQADIKAIKDDLQKIKARLQIPEAGALPPVGLDAGFVDSALKVKAAERHEAEAKAAVERAARSRLEAISSIRSTTESMDAHRDELLKWAKEKAFASEPAAPVPMKTATPPAANPPAAAPDPNAPATPPADGT
jgi:hypothetical protein